METDTNGDYRNSDGTFAVGNPGGPGRPVETEEKKLIKRAVKELVAEYQENLAQFLPDVAPSLIKKAIEGDVPAIKEFHDRIMGKAEQKSDITSGGKPIPLLHVLNHPSNTEGSESK